MAADEVFRARVEAEVDGLDDVEKLARSLDELDGEKVEIPVEVDDQAGRDIDDLLEKVDRLHVEPAQLLLATNAAQITTDIADLLLDIDKLDSTDPTVDVKIERVNQLKGDLDQIQAKAREISDTPIDLDTDRGDEGASTTSAVGQLVEVGAGQHGRQRHPGSRRARRYRRVGRRGNRPDGRVHGRRRRRRRQARRPARQLRQGGRADRSDLDRHGRGVVGARGPTQGGRGSGAAHRGVRQRDARRGDRLDRARRRAARQRDGDARLRRLVQRRPR